MVDQKVTFGVLQTRLVEFVNYRIRNGDFTERGLARVIGISQPQLHNVLKGARKLQPELADVLMAKFDIGVADLLAMATTHGDSVYLPLEYRNSLILQRNL